jgi:hypothetical protein|uniref:Ubiquitin-like protein ATG12 n=1 Tax=viral metagenome TaxID=1070528 RepID=A0A6C0BLV4_9ZZZZ
MLTLDQLKSRYPDHIFVQVKSKTRALTINYSKFIISGDMTLSYFISHLITNNEIKLPQNASLIIYIDNLMPHYSALMNTLYRRHNQGGILVINLCIESVFG